MTSDVFGVFLTNLIYQPYSDTLLYIKLYVSLFTRVSIQGVKSLGGHFACLCWGFDFCEVKKNPFIYSKKHTFLTKKCLNNKKFRKSDRYSLFVLIVKKMN